MRRIEWKYTEENPLRVVTLCSGYDSQLMALRNIGVPYECVAWSEIDKYAIMAHNAVFPEIADRNLGDMTKIDWKAVPDFDVCENGCVHFYPVSDGNIEIISLVEGEEEPFRAKEVKF